MGTNKVFIEGLSISAPQMKQFWEQVEVGAINGANFQLFLDHRNPFALEAINLDWAKAYKLLGMAEQYEAEAQALGSTTNPSLWDVPVLKGVTPNKVIAAFRQLGVPVSLYVENLDEGVPTNDRDPAKGSYRVSFCRTIEADPEHKNKSARQLATANFKGITLLERLLLELAYFLATGNHLDLENVTLCAGSRYSGGGVPGVFWCFGRLRVVWFFVGVAFGRRRAREAVS